MVTSRRALLTAAGALSLPLANRGAHAQAPFPSRPIRVIVPFAPGGSNDLVARLLAPRLQATLGQSVLVENRSGAGGSIGAQAVARAEPDGHTILFHSSSIVINPILSRDPGYDVRNDFSPVSMMTEAQLVLVVHPSLPVRNLMEFLAYVRANGSRLFYGSAGTGGTQHLVGELFNSMVGVKMQHVPFRGNGPATAALLGGEIQVFFDIVPIAKPLAETGQVRILGVTSKTRSPSLPDVPTIHEAGLAGFDFTFWQAMLLPRGAAPAVVERWLAAARTVLTSPEIEARLAEQGFVVATSSPAALAERIARETVQFGRLIAEAGIRPE